MAYRRASKRELVSLGWSKANIPNHAFISWLAALGKLRTREILQKAGVCITQHVYCVMMGLILILT